MNQTDNVNSEVEKGFGEQDGLKEGLIQLVVATKGAGHRLARM
jgi:hypothetical protein